MCETEKDSRTSRSRCSSRSGRRGSKNGTKKASISGIQTHGAFTLRPKAPSSPRAICHATWGPVHTSIARPSRSSTITCAISSPPAYQLTCQRPGPFANVSRRTRSCLRSSSRSFGCARGDARRLHGVQEVVARRARRARTAASALRPAAPPGWRDLGLLRGTQVRRRAPSSAAGERYGQRRRGAGLPKLHSLLPMKLSGVAARIAIACASDLLDVAVRSRAARARSG